MTYQFIKDYKNDETARSSFNALARQTFGIDFETWYHEGFWNDNYICYSFLKDGKIVSNVSVNKMNLILNGKQHKAIQIGTVMTDPAHRRKGLAYDLMQKALLDFEGSYGLYFLAADRDAVPLYEKCGFRYNEENRFEVGLDGYRLLQQPLEPVPVIPEVLLDIKRQSRPLSNVLSATGDEHVLMFYYTAGFSGAIYQPRPNVYVIFEIEGDTLHLYDILSPIKVELQELVEEITPSSVNKVVFHFTPDSEVKGLIASIDQSSKWMLRSLDGVSFPRLARFPRISQT